jgi:hypothetical protein
MKTILIHADRLAADAIVDDEDYLYLHQFHWKMYNGWAVRYKNGRSCDPVFMQHEVARRAGITTLEIEHISGDTLDNRRENIQPTNDYKTILLHHPADLDQIVTGTMVDYEDFAYLDKWNWRFHFGCKQAFREESGKTIFMCNVVWERAGHKGPPLEHVSDNLLDNRRANLRKPTRKYKPAPVYQNAIDHGDKWQARISIDLEPIHLGFFPTPEEAETMYGNVKEKVMATIQAAVAPDPTAVATPMEPHWSEIAKCWLCRIKLNGKVVSIGHASTHGAAKIYTNTYFTTEAP